MQGRIFFFSSLLGLFYSIVGYGGFLIWNYYEISKTPIPYSSGGDMAGFFPSFFIGIIGLSIQIIFIPGSFILQLFKNLGLPVFTNQVPFPYHGSISILGLLLGSMILTILSGLIGLVIYLISKHFAKLR